MMRSPALLAAAVVLFGPESAFAVGSDDDTPPTPTATTETCENGQIWDKTTETCIDAKESRLNDTIRGEAVRELAYAEAYDRALQVLDSFDNPDHDMRLTYLGFVSRKTGDIDQGMAWYQAALTANPDNLLARSYLGQAFVQMGDSAAAHEQLTQIRARGGRQTWAEQSLALTLTTGTSPSY